jgi:hypothetical protein
MNRVNCTLILSDNKPVTYCAPNGKEVTVPPLPLCASDRTVTYIAPNGNHYRGEAVLDDLTKRLIDRLNQLISQDRCEREDLELLGEFLYRVLLPVGDGLDQNNLRRQIERDYDFFARRRSDNDRFRVTLELHKEASDLAKYPWEFLFVRWAERGFFLAGEQSDLILTRFVPKVPPEINIKTEEPLRILVAFSHPYELGDIKSTVTTEVINDIKSLGNSEHIEVRVEDNPTHNKLCQLMSREDVPGDAQEPPENRARFRPDIFHFIGHGEPNKLALIRDEKAIALDEDKGKSRVEADWCDANQVVKLFNNHTPRLVFLHACDGAKADSVTGLSDLARELVYDRVPIVIAMQYSIKNKDAALFARTFYERIRNNSEIDEAVRAGREALGQKQDKKGSWSDRRFGTPVVYLQTDSQRAIVNFPIEQSRSEEVSYDRNEKIACPNPECDSRVLPDWKKCVKCEHEVMKCPQCLSVAKECHMLDKSIGRCAFCDYQVGRLATPLTAVGSMETRSSSTTDGSATATASISTTVSERVDEQSAVGPARPLIQESMGFKTGEEGPVSDNSIGRVLKDGKV